MKSIHRVDIVTPGPDPSRKRPPLDRSSTTYIPIPEIDNEHLASYDHPLPSAGYLDALCRGTGFNQIGIHHVVADGRLRRYAALVATSVFLVNPVYESLLPAHVMMMGLIGAWLIAKSPRAALIMIAAAVLFSADN